MYSPCRFLQDFPLLCTMRLVRTVGLQESLRFMNQLQQNARTRFADGSGVDNTGKVYRLAGFPVRLTQTDEQIHGAKN